MTCIFSDDRRHRYVLRRDFMFGKGIVNFLMLNPSTADENRNDPTIERCERRAKRWGYRSLVITNLFAYRATNPEDMKGQDDPVGEMNDAHILAEAFFADKVICGWGNHGSFRGRSDHVLSMLAAEGIALHAFSATSKGQPQHPLYVAYAVEPFVWKP